MNGRSAPDTVFDRFAAIADAHRNDAAFTDGTRTITHGELHDRAIAMEHSIAGLGSTDPGLIGILTTDRVGAIVAMLGVAASGHAYVLLDAGDPDKRLAGIIAEAAPFALMADSALLDRASALTPAGGKVINIDDIGSGESRPDALVKAQPDSLLYVSFTSGSTGVPKGVCQSHRNLIFYVDRYIETMRIKAGNPISWLFSHGASASNMDIYGALFTGAKLCAFEIKSESFEAMADWIDAERLTLLHTVPTVVRELSGAVAPNRVFKSVDVVDLAGEMLFAGDVAKMRPHFREDCLILNRLAATEASFIASFEVTAEHERWRGALPVGTPPDQLEISIVDERGTPVVRGEKGFIAISSPHVALGYLNQPDLNAATFADVKGKPGWRTYTSADLGFLDDEGNLNFIGRSGSRIKLRGQAVDLAEVEAALYACPGVTGAIVIADIGEGQEARAINAFLTLAPGEEKETAAIRKSLSEALPAYMLPSGYAFLDQFPMTATSKVDRKALAELDLGKVRFRPGYEPPEDEVEQRVTAIFEEVLNVRGVGRLDDFFALGGDSLSLVNLQILATETFGRQFDRIHEESSVQAIAAGLRSTKPKGDAGSSLLLAIRPEGSAPPLFMVHGRRGIAHVGPQFLELLGPDQPLYSLQAKGLDSKTPPHSSIEEMAADYVAAIREVQPKGPYFIGGFCAGSYVAIEMIRILRKEGERFFQPLLIDPPFPSFPGSGDALPEEWLLNSIRRRVEIGQWKVDLQNEDAVEGAIRVARAFEDSLHRYKPRSVAIPAMIIASKVRWKNFANVRSVFGNRAIGFMIEGRHADLMKPENKAFATAIRRCVAGVAAAAEQLKSAQPA